MLSIKFTRLNRWQRNIKGINLEVKAGEIHAIMGPNGAGKVHLLRSLQETSEVTDGEISLEGRRSSRISQKKSA
jgi:Fe-S cluster assembly ATP-binding protein